MKENASRFEVGTDHTRWRGGGRSFHDIEIMSYFDRRQGLRKKTSQSLA
jgi:hypothetical protein